MKRLFKIDPWKLTTDRLEIEDKRLQESLTSLGNGYMGMRGNFEEGYSGDTHVGTYLAGVWYPDKTRVGWWKIGYPEYFGKVVNALNFIPVDIYVGKQKVDLAVDTVKDFSIELDMKKGILYRSFVWYKDETEIRFSFKRYVSVVRKELAVVTISASILKGGAEIYFVPTLDGDVKNEDSNYEEKFWVERNQRAAEKSFLTTKTVENPFGTEQFTVTAMMQTLKQEGFNYQTYEGKEMQVSETIGYRLQKDETAEITKLISVVTSRDHGEAKQVEAAEAVLTSAIESGVEELEIEHSEAWAERWHKADIKIEGDDEGQQGIRFNIFQLFSTYYGEDSRLNIGPKGFTGEKYGGATYWDTEAYILPMYLATADEEVSRQLLAYRYNQLPGAYHNARQQGLKGALYPMVTFNGIESHNEWEITFEEIHRNGTIAYAIYNYTNYTGDETYLLTNGIDVLIGISRFWADRVHYSERNQRYMIHGVTGPNEYENNVNNNWYTNVMAAWTLRYTLESLQKIPAAKRSELSITTAEEENWRMIIDQMYYPYEEELGIFIQHDGFLDKELRTVDALSPEERPINQHWSWDKILRSPFIKQADVLQGLYYLNNEFSLEEKKRNFEFYEPMTVHESSLSPSIHAILAAEIGKRKTAFNMYARTSRLDLDNYNNDSEDGLHITSMSGGWLAIVQGFAGMRTADEALSFKPYCPKNWDSYTFKIQYRKRLLDITVTKDKVSLVLEEGRPLFVKLYDDEVQLTDSISIPIH